MLWACGISGQLLDQVCYGWPLLIRCYLSLNAISLVNLVISLGIAVEFCSHIARGYMSSTSGAMMDGTEGQKEREERVFTAMADVGPSVGEFNLIMRSN